MGAKRLFDAELDTRIKSLGSKTDRHIAANLVLGALLGAAITLAADEIAKAIRGES